MEVTTPNTPESPPSVTSVLPMVESMTLDLPKLVSHEHRLQMLSELTGYRLPKQHRGKYFLLTDLFSLHAFLKRRNASKRIHALPIQGKWIKLHSGGRYCTLSAFDKHVLKYIQTEYARKILEYLSVCPNAVETEDEDDDNDVEEDQHRYRLLEDEVGNEERDVSVQRVNGEGDAIREEDMLDELEHDVTESAMDLDSKPSNKPHRFQRNPPSVKYGSSMSFKTMEGTNGTTRMGRSRSNPSSFSSTSTSSASYTSNHNLYSPARARTSAKRPNELPIPPESTFRQQHKIRAIQIQEDMIKEERSCVQFLYTTLRQLHQQIATEYKEETAKQISVITEQLKQAKTRLKEVLEFDI